MIKLLSLFVLYGLAFAMLWAGSNGAPAHGWPVNDTQLNACALLVLGLILKTFGHAILLGMGSAR